VRRLRVRIRQPAPPEPGELPGLVARLADGSSMGSEARAQLLDRLGGALGASARRAGAAAVASGRWLAELLEEFSPYMPVRDLDTLRKQHDGLVGDELADRLIDVAARSTGAMGVASSLAASIEFSAPPFLLAAPVPIVAETVAVVAIEVKLVAELHQVYGMGVTGTPAVRTAAYLGSWTRRRGIDPAAGRPAMVGMITGVARRDLRRRLVRRGARNTVSLLPFMAGAAAGASLNSKETRALGEEIAADLARSQRH
jgi:uncharacterized protein (DUF697 family)